MTTKKNIVWWIGVKNPDHTEKYGGFDYFDYSRKTWEYWCKKNDCLFVPFEEPVESNLKRFRINWQKIIYVFDEMDSRKIEYDQIALVDSTCMIKWNAPNFFELTGRRFTGWRDLENLRWLYESIEGYKLFFDNFELDYTRYINSGFIIFNENHKEFINSFKQLYLDNIDAFINLQDNIVKKGNEQTSLNYWLQIKGIDVNMELSQAFKLTHLHRKELFGYNWQLNESDIPHFIKYGNNWIFNGIPKDQRTRIMGQTWDLVGREYQDDVLEKVSHKNTHKFTTSRKFKSDLLGYFGDQYKDKKIVEIGCSQGMSTRVLAELFQSVIAVDHDDWNLNQARHICMGTDNVKFKKFDLYKDEWNLSKSEVVFIDAGHEYHQVISDIENSIKYIEPDIIVFDDYGHPTSTGVKTAIDEKINDGTLEFIKHVGHPAGTKLNDNLTIVDWEGIICKVKNHE